MDLAKPTTTSGARRHPRLICAPDQIFNDAAIWQALSQRDSTLEGTALRGEIVPLIRDAQQAGRKAIAAGFAESPFDARAMTSSYTYLTDQLLRCVLQIATQVLHPNPNPTEGERLAMIGVGGLWPGGRWPRIPTSICSS